MLHVHNFFRILKEYTTVRNYYYCYYYYYAFNKHQSVSSCEKTIFS